MVNTETDNTPDEPEEDARQPAPSPASIHVPPGHWRLTIATKAGDNLVPALEVDGPVEISISLDY